MSRVYTGECTIDAPPQAVWDVLVDTAAYPEWNPFTPRVGRDLVVGQRLFLTARMDGWFGVVLPMWERVREVREPERLVWGEHILFGLVRAERVQTLTPVDGGTRYRTEDTIEGPLAPLVHLLFGGSLARGFQAMANALAERVATRR